MRHVRQWKIYVSADGATWTLALSGTSENEIYDLAAFDGKCMPARAQRKVFSSTGGASWNEVLSGTGETMLASWRPLAGSCTQALIQAAGSFNSPCSLQSTGSMGPPRSKPVRVGLNLALSTTR